MSEALEPKTLSIKARDWMANILSPLIVALVVGLGGSYFTVRVNVAVLEQQNKTLSEQNSKLADEIKELRTDMRTYLGQLYTKDEHAQYNDMITMRFKDYTGKFIDFRMTMSDISARVRSLELDARSSKRDG